MTPILHFQSLALYSSFEGKWVCFNWVRLQYIQQLQEQGYPVYLQAHVKFSCCIYHGVIRNINYFCQGTFPNFYLTSNCLGILHIHCQKYVGLMCCLSSVKNNSSAWLSLLWDKAQHWPRNPGLKPIFMTCETLAGDCQFLVHNTLAIQGLLAAQVKHPSDSGKRRENDRNFQLPWQTWDKPHIDKCKHSKEMGSTEKIMRCIYEKGQAIRGLLAAQVKHPSDSGKRRENNRNFQLPWQTWDKPNIHQCKNSKEMGSTGKIMRCIFEKGQTKN